MSGLGSHELSYTATHRTITGLSDTASPTVRGDAGDSTKSSLTHTLTRDTRPTTHLPTSGSLLINTTELAGVGPLKGDVAFLKNQTEANFAFSLPAGITATIGMRGGFIQPLPLADGTTPASKINDRFFLGGATDVRGFRECGLGPRDGNDAVGGDVFGAAGASLFFPIPKLGRESPLRLQAFVNGGRLVGVQKGGDEQEGGVLGAMKEVIREVPSCAAGVGLVYAHPQARFELNFALPVVKRVEERGRKGVQFGVGIEFL